MNRKVLNSSLVVIGLVVLAILATYIKVEATMNSVVVIKTSGMNCRSCAEQITKLLQSESGVASTEVDIDKGTVVAGYDAHLSTHDKLAAKISAIGFDSKVQSVLTPEQYKAMSGHNIGNKEQKSGCCCQGGNNADKK